MRLQFSILMAVLLTFGCGIAAPTGAQSPTNRSVQPLAPQGGASVADASNVVQGALQGAGVISNAAGGGISNIPGVAALGTLLDTVQALNETMEGFEPNYSANGMPGIPLSCEFVGEGEDPSEAEACTQCYIDATGQIDDVRVDFERLRAVGKLTKAMVDAALAFGDSFSTVAGNGSLGWPQSRPEVIASYESFKVKYAASRQGILSRLDIGLRAIDTCESVHFDNPDWYNRYGFIYFAFMEGHYALD